MRRIVILLTVVALMVGILSMSVAPVLAAPESPCPGAGGSGNLVQTTTETSQYDRNSNGYVCKYDRYDREFNLVSTRYKDDRQFF